MAELGRTVRVSGLPTDIEDDRLKDKLLVHFLRGKNGGGEIDSVTIVKAPLASALITFEDSRVAQRVIQHSRHALEVDGKKHKVIVTEHCENQVPDKVILSLSATVNCSQLPGGIIALTSLHRNHPDIQINYDATEQWCTLYGSYSKVQAALAQLLGHPGGPKSVEGKDSGSATSSSTSVQIAPKPCTQESDDQSKKSNKQREQRETVHSSRPSDENNSSSLRDLIPGGYGWEDTGQTEGAALQLPGHPTTLEEDHSLIVDADMFQYMQKYCRKEYQHILRQYGVEVVDMTNQGLTTLYLHVAAAVGENGQDQERLKMARKAISSLYHEKEGKICRAQLPKGILSPRGGLQRAMENLSSRLPKLLLNEDDRNIYFIGSSSDVSEAKHFLLLNPSEVQGKKDDVASGLRFPLCDSGSPDLVDEQKAPLPKSSTTNSVDEGIDHLLRAEEDDWRAEGARRYKLAARFKDSGLAALGNRPTDFTVRGLSSPRQTCLGPMLGHDVLSETAEGAGERVSRALAQNTGGDILFKSRDVLPSTTSMQNKLSLNSHLTDIQPKGLTPPLSALQSSLSGCSPLPPAGSGSTLKRANSFSGIPPQRAQVKSPKSQDDSSKTIARGRSSSLSNQTGKDKQEVYNAQIIVSSVMWQHIKEAYRNLVDDLTSDVQIKESWSGSSSDLTVTLRGANSSKVSSCKLGLQNLLDSVSVDFCLQELCLSELGITNREDETLQACCDEVRSQFKKVTIQVSKESVFLFGPKMLCSQVGATLREVFSTDLSQIPEQQDLSTPTWNRSTAVQPNEDQGYGNPQLVKESQTNKADGTSSSRERRANKRSDFLETELVNGSVTQPLVRKEPVIKEKVKTIGTVLREGQKAETVISHAKTGSSRHLNAVRSATTRTDKDLALHKEERTVQSIQSKSSQEGQTKIQDTSKESRSHLGFICVCGDSEKMMTRTKCGATMCSKCLDTVHVHCRVCHVTELTPRGIQGKITYSKLPISVPGYNKDTAIKITYCIPDGIQGEGHPCPGKPFQGGVFEAFLPDCEKTSKVLPRLEEAFRQGLTFTVVGKDSGARVTWDCVPHKTSLQGGKSANGYPDSTYFTRLSEVLSSHGIEEPTVKS